tara:strand:+ start:169 stop:687 length:519 start_codon:yes stop_codon:yes gene_type:complete
MDKIQKKETVNNLKESFESSDGVVVTHYLGLNTAELTELRVKVGEVGARFCVAKNSLVKLASKDTVYKGLEEYFNGPTALVFSKDPIAGIKVIKKYTEKNEKLKIIKASLNDKIIDDNELEALSKLPSLEEIRAKIAGYLIAPHQQLISVLNASGVDLVGVFNNLSNKKEKN